MKKLYTLALFPLLLTSCASKPRIVYWSSFGSDLTAVLNGLIEEYNETLDGYEIFNQSKGSYEGVQEAIEGGVGTGTYPNFANGYPDHFASYIDSDIMLELDSFIAEYDEAHREELDALGYESIVDDYYEEYMKENLSLKYDDEGKGYVMGLPFNKSTEVLVYNGYLLDYFQSVDPTIEIPQTYEGWMTVGQKILTVVLNNLAGKKLCAKIGEDGHASDFAIIEKNGSVPTGLKEIGDMTAVHGDIVKDGKVTDPCNFTVFSWDALDNMFITMVRQFGAQYTSYTEADVAIGHGWATYWYDTNKAKTKEALQTIVDMHNAGIFKTSTETNSGNFNSANFLKYQVFAMVSSTAGMKNNVTNDNIRVRIAPVPYKDADHKYVISQGTNLGLFKKGNMEDARKAFNAMVTFTTGEFQAAWAAISGYYPASKTAYNSPTYQAILTTDTQDQSALERAYNESAQTNGSEYMNAEKNWIKFVDPGFVGSSQIRTASKGIVSNIIKDGADIDKCVEDALHTINSYVKK